MTFSFLPPRTHPADPKVRSRQALAERFGPRLLRLHVAALGLALRLLCRMADIHVVVAVLWTPRVWRALPLLRVSDLVAVRVAPLEPASAQHA